MYKSILGNLAVERDHMYLSAISEQERAEMIYDSHKKEGGVS